MKIYYKSKKLHDVFIYIWDCIPKENKSVWPGVKMVKHFNNWFYIEILDIDFCRLIFSNGADEKSEDLFRDRDGWYQDGKWYDFNPDLIDSFLFPGGKNKTMLLTFEIAGVEDLYYNRILDMYGLKGLFCIDTEFYYNKMNVSFLKKITKNHELGITLKENVFTEKDEEFMDLVDCELNYLINSCMINPISSDQELKEIKDKEKFNEIDLSFQLKIIKKLEKNNKIPINFLSWNPNSELNTGLELSRKYLNHYTGSLNIFFIFVSSSKETPRVKSRKLEEICRYLSLRNIWYTTPQGLLKYIKNINNIVHLGENRFKNPETNGPLWIKDNKFVKKIFPGEDFQMVVR